MQRHHLWLLANTDSSVTSVHLPAGFRFEAPDEDSAILTLSDLERSDVLDSRPIVPSPYLRMRLRRFLPAQALMPSGGGRTRVVWIRRDGETELTTEEFLRLHNILGLMRLFKTGNLTVVAQYQWEEENSRRTGFGMTWSPWPAHQEEYVLVGDEPAALERFIATHSPTPPHPHLRVGLQLMDLSYLAAGRGLAFIAIAAGLEALVNPGRQELTYRVSRNVAGLLAKDVGSFRATRKEVKALYEKRSAFVHNGDEREITEADVIRFRHLLRETIKAAWDSGLSRQDLLEDLDSRGFAASYSGPE